MKEIMNIENKNLVPVHVSLIMDGNGRWAKERGKERVFGHFEGVESVRACVEAAVETGVKYLSIFAFSEENWNRPEDEVVALMGLMVKAMAAEMEKLNRNGVRFMVLGNRERLGNELNKTIDDCMDMTKDNETLTLIVFLSYSGKWDILQAAKKLALEMLEHPERREELEAMDIAEKEANAEMLLEAKGFTNVVVSINENSCDVVLDMGEITDAKRAQVEDIVKRKTGVKADKIVITPLNTSKNE